MRLTPLFLLLVAVACGPATEPDPLVLLPELAEDMSQVEPADMMTQDIEGPVPDVEPDLSTQDMSEDLPHEMSPPAACVAGSPFYCQGETLTSCQDPSDTLDCAGEGATCGVDPLTDRTTCVFANPCSGSLDEGARYQAWRDERVAPGEYQLATMSASGRISNATHEIEFDRSSMTLKKLGEAEPILDCTWEPSFADRSCQLSCQGRQGFSRQLRSPSSGARTKVCHLRGLGLTDNTFGFAISHLDYGSWVWTMDLASEGFTQSGASLGPVYIKFFELRRECLRLWHTREKLTGQILPVVPGPMFKLFDLRNLLVLPRLTGEIDEDTFFIHAGERVLQGD